MGEKWYERKAKETKGTGWAGLLKKRQDKEGKRCDSIVCVMKANHAIHAEITVVYRDHIIGITRRVAIRSLAQIRERFSSGSSKI